MTIKIKDLPISERPYEKLEIYGEKSLSNSELLAIILKTGTKDETVIEIAQKILAKIDYISDLEQLSLLDLTKIKGIGRIKSIQIKTVCELARRISQPIDMKAKIIKNPRDIIPIVEELQYETVEKILVIVLDSKNVIKKIKNVAIGGINSSSIEPNLILAENIKMEMPKFIIVHNHPSGNANPSKADIEFTKRINEASKIMGLQLLDHIIIGKQTYESIFSKYKGYIEKE